MAELLCNSAFPAQLTAQAKLVCAAALSSDGVEPLSEQAEALICADSDPAVIHAWALEEGCLVGYGNVDRRRIPTIEVVVHPLYRRQGIGEKLLCTLLGSATDYSAQPDDSGTADDADKRPMVWAHGDLSAASHLAQKLHLERSRELLQMSCSPANLTTALPSLPANSEILTFTEADNRFGETAMNAEIVRVNNAAFSWHPEQSGWDTAQVVSHRNEPWFTSDDCFVALAPGDGSTTFGDAGAVSGTSGARPRVAGFVWTKIHGVSTDASTELSTGKIGELYLVGVDPAMQGQRIGTVLTSLALRQLATRHVSQFILYVEGDNTAALKVYERHGFTISRCDVAYRYDRCKYPLTEPR